MATGGPWGGGSGGGDRGNENDPKDRDEDRQNGGRRPANEGTPIPEIDQIVKKGQEQLRVLMGGRGRGGFKNGGGNGGGNRPSAPPLMNKQGLALAAVAAVAVWGYLSFYTVRPEERSVELFLGEFSTVGNPGLNFAPWPFVTKEIVQVTTERTTDIGLGRAGEDGGLMVTRDQNIVDIGFQVVWNIEDPSKFLFNLVDPADTIRAVSESAMRDIIARSELSPILNRDRGAIANDLRAAVQATLDSYGSGLNVIRVNFEKADPPREVIDAFRSVQAAQQERDRLEKEADAYANRVTAGARGDAARLLEEAEAYRARVVNDAAGEASRFTSVYEEYIKAPEVTRMRMYLETMEGVLGGMNKVIMDGVDGGVEGGQGQGVVPILPLNDLVRPQAGAAQSGTNATGAAAVGGAN